MECIRRLLRMLGLIEQTALPISEKPDNGGNEMKTKLHLCENPNYGGKKMDFSESCDDLTEYFPDGVQSVRVEKDSPCWQVFPEVQFAGEPRYLSPGDYNELKKIRLISPVKSFRRAPNWNALTLYEARNLSGKQKAFTASCEDLTIDFPDGASSIMVDRHSRTWQVFSETHFRGATVNLHAGKRYKNLEQMLLVRPVKSFRKAPPPPPFIPFRRRRNDNA